MKTKLKRVGKSALSSVLCVMMVISTMLIGTFTTNAATNTGGYIYFELPSSWGSPDYVQFGMYQSTNQYLYLQTMTQIANTNLYYVSATDHSSWIGEDQIMFIANSSEYSSRSFDGTDSSCYTAKLTLNVSSGNYYCFTPTSTDATGTAISYTSSSSYSILNKTITVTEQVSSDGSSYETATTAPATISISGNRFSSSATTTCGTSSSGSITADKSTVTTSAALGWISTATMTVSDVSSDYNFDGWYSGDELLSSDTTYFYTVSDTATVYARFSESGTKLTTPTIELSDDGTSEPVITVTNTGDIASAASSAEITYTLYDSSDNEVESGNITGGFTVSASGTYYVKAVTSTDGYTNSAASNSVTATVPTYYIGGRFKVTDGDTTTYTGSDSDDWEVTSTNIPLTADSSDKNLYYLNTGFTVAELSTSSTSGYPLYFWLHDNGTNSTGTTYYYVPSANVDNMEDYSSESNSVALSSTTSRGNLIMQFTNTSSTNNIPVTLWFNSSTGAFWYTAGVAYDITNGGTDGNGSISVDESAYSGSTVTVTASPNEGYILDTVTVKGASDTYEVTVSGNTATFTMPTENVTVIATFRELETYTVTLEQSSGGTVSGDYVTVTEGNRLLFTAVADNDYAFSTWVVSSGTYDTTQSETDLTSTSLYIYPTSDITLTATFVEDSGTATGIYLLYGTSSDSGPSNWYNQYNAKVYKSANKQDGESDYSSYTYEYYADIPVADITTTSNYYFGISSSISYDNLYWTTDEQTAATVSKVDSANVVTGYGPQSGNWNNTSGTSTWYTFGRASFSSDLSAVTKIRIIVGYANNESGTTISTGAYYCIVPIVDSAKANATIVTAYDGYSKSSGVGNANYGDSTIATSDDITLKASADSYSSYYVQPNTTFTVTTEVTSTNASYGWYVGAYSVDGVYYSATDLGSNKYSVTVTAGSDDIDIYPIYYNSNIDDDNNYVTLYVDDWETVLLDSSSNAYASNVYVYPYYYTGSGTDAKQYFGDFPGFKLTKTTTGKAVVKIPKYYYDSQGNVSTYEISGVTFSFNSSGTYQTYDYDDFVVISELDNVDIIEFDVKYETTKYNKESIYSDADDGTASTSNITLSDYGTNGNGWELLTDYDGNNVDLYYDTVTKTSDSDAIYIVSSGNWNSQSTLPVSGSHKIGEWSTVWTVYDADGTYIGTDAPSDFIGDDSNAAKITSLSSSVAGKITYITYEQVNTPSDSYGQTSNINARVDGRWVYTTSSSSFESFTQAYYSTATSGYDSETASNWTQDETGTTAGSATIAGMTATSTTDNVYTYSFSDRTSEVTLSASPANGYVLYKWVMVTKDESSNTVFTDLTGTQATANNPVITMDGSYTIAALFIPLGDTTLSINHSMYTGTGANLGNGTFLVSASVINSSGVAQNIYFTNATSGTLDLDDIITAISGSDQYYIAITLTTTPSGMNTFNTWYQATDDGYAEIGPNDESEYDAVTATPTDYSGSTDTVTLTFYVDVYSLLNESENGLDVQNLNYFSDINKVTLNVTLNYNYADRFAEADEDGNYTPNKTYTVSATLDDTYIENGTINYDGDAFQKLVTENAPAIDDLWKNATWVVTSYSQASGAINLTAVQETKTYNGTIKYLANSTDTELTIASYSDVAWNGFVYNGDDAFYSTASENANGDTFLYWTISTEDGSVLAYCFETYFNLRITADNCIIEACYGTSETNTYAAIGSPTYTVETFTDSSTGTDTSYIYADFLISYYETDEDGNLIQLKYDDGTYVTGIVYVINSVAVLDLTSTNEDGSLVTDYTNYSFTVEADWIKAYVTGTSTTYLDSTATTTVSETTYSNSTNRLYNFVIDNSAYNSYNRLDYYLRYNNTTSSTKYVYQAFYYVYQVDENGDYVEGTFVLSSGVYYSLYEASIQDATTVTA